MKGGKENKRRVSEPERERERGREISNISISNVRRAGWSTTVGLFLLLRAGRARVNLSV